MSILESQSNSPALDPLASDSPAPVAGAYAGPASETERSLLGVIELVLKAPNRLNRLLREPTMQVELIPRFLGIALAGFSIFAVTMTLVFDAAGSWPALSPVADWLSGTAPELLRFDSDADRSVLSRWIDGSALSLLSAYAFGLIAANGVCLPSFYFYGLLAGVRTSMLEVAAHAIRCTATAAIALVGILPIYMAFVLGMVVFSAPTEFLRFGLFLGLALPFIAGLFGVRATYLGFLDLADRLPEDRRQRGLVFLRRLILAWSACYTAVTPVMIHAIWEYLTR